MSTKDRKKGKGGSRQRIGRREKREKRGGAGVGGSEQ